VGVAGEVGKMFNVTNPCSTLWATRSPISARSAPVRSPSSCTIAPVP
jgi:hypothetical protein